MKLKLNQNDSDHLNVYGYTIVSDQDAPPLIILTLDGLQDFADHFCSTVRDYSTDLVLSIGSH